MIFKSTTRLTFLIRKCRGYYRGTKGKSKDQKVKDQKDHQKVKVRRTSPQKP